MSELEYIDRIYKEIIKGKGKLIEVIGFKDRDVLMMERVMIKLRLLDLLIKHPSEAKQCEMIWKPIYDEYRRVNYRLNSEVQTKLDI